MLNQRNSGRERTNNLVLRKTRSNVEKKLKEKKRSQNDVTASVSADHDYNGQNLETNSNIITI